MKTKAYLLIVCLFALQLNAQEQPKDLDIFDMSLEELMNLEVSSASKFAQKATDAPAKVYVVTHQQIEERNYYALLDLLDDIPQIEVGRGIQTQNNNQITINGIVGNEKFIVFINGIRHTAASGNAHSLGESYSLENVKQVEIILGPSSSLYGADAFTGIINIQTFEGHENQGLRAQASYGMYNTQRHSLTYNLGNQDYAFSLSGKYFATDQAFLPDYYPNEYQGYTDYQNTGTMKLFGRTVTPAVGTLPWDARMESYSVRANLKLKNWHIGYSRLMDRQPTSQGALPSESIFAKEASWANTLQVLSVRNTWDINEKMQLQSFLWAQHGEVDPTSTYINNFTSYGLMYKYRLDRSIRLEEQFTYRFTDTQNLVMGLMLEHISALPKSGDLPTKYDTSKSPSEQNIFYPGTQITDYEGKSLAIRQDFFPIDYQNYALYGQYNLQLYQSLALTLGSRFDHNSRYGNTFNPRVGLVYRPNSDWSVKLLYGQAYLAPSPDKTFQHYGSFRPATDTNGQVVGLASSFWYLPSPELKPERRNSWDAVLQYQLNPNLALSVNGYYSELFDLITSATFSKFMFKGVEVATVQKAINNGITVSYGGTARLDYRGNLTEQLQLDLFAAYAYSDGHTNSTPLRMSSPHTIKAGVTLSWNSKLSWYTRLDHRSGARPESAPANLDLWAPAATVLSSTINYRFNFGPKLSTTLFTKVTNLTDARYFLAGSQTMHIVPQSPILAEVGLKLAY